MAADEASLLQGDDRGRFKRVPSLGDGSWGVRDRGDDAGHVGVDGRVGVVELVHRTALHQLRHSAATHLGDAAPTPRS